MINLLPPDVKTNYRYARRNRTLLRWISICGIGLLGAIILTGFGYVYMDSTTATFEKQTAAANEQLKIQNITGVQKQVTDISNKIKINTNEDLDPHVTCSSPRLRGDIQYPSYS